MFIVIDSREQDPYDFVCKTKIGTLTTGDYSVAGLEAMVAVERKSLPDLISSIGTGRERFERELQRAKALDYFALVVECNFEDIATGNYRSKMNAMSAVQTLMAFSIRYRLPIFFAGDRTRGQHITESLLTKYLRELEKSIKAINLNRKASTDKLF